MPHSWQRCGHWCLSCRTPPNYSTVSTHPSPTPLQLLHFSSALSAPMPVPPGLSVPNVSSQRLESFFNSSRSDWSLGRAVFSSLLLHYNNHPAPYVMTSLPDGAQSSFCPLLIPGPVCTPHPTIKLHSNGGNGGHQGPRSWIPVQPSRIPIWTDWGKSCKSHRRNLPLYGMLEALPGKDGQASSDPMDLSKINENLTICCILDNKWGPKFRYTCYLLSCIKNFRSLWPHTHILWSHLSNHSNGQKFH